MENHEMVSNAEGLSTLASSEVFAVISSSCWVKSTLNLPDSATEASIGGRKRHRALGLNRLAAGY